MKKKLLVLTSLLIMSFAITACSDQGDYYEGFITDVEEEGEKGDVIPTGGKYERAASGKTFFEGENMPVLAGEGDVYTCGDYTYTMKSNGWSVSLSKNTDKTKTAYGEILETIASCSVVEMVDLFKGCSNLTVSPKIPSTVTNMNNAFYECTALEQAPELPAGVVDIQYLFYNCTNLKTVPVIPETVTSLKYTFNGCASITEAPVIPEAVTNVLYAFTGCVKLTKAPKMPSKLKVMGFAFSDCTSLLEGPEVPETVTDMAGTFKNCTSLVKGPNIPANVKYFSDTFNACTSLTGTIVIDANPSDVTCCFRLVNFSAQGLEITGSSTKLEKMKGTGITE